MQATQKIQQKSTFFRRRGHRTRGLTLIETAMAMAILALASAFAIQQIFAYMERVHAKTIADKMIEVSEGAKGYVKANYAALLANAGSGVLVIPAGRPNATAAVPSGPAGLPSIQGDGFLTSSFIDVNGFGQRHALLVKKMSPDKLEAIVTTYGGRTIADNRLAMIGNFVGNSGGYIPQTPPVAADANTIIGAYGGYRSDLASWGGAAERPTVGHFQSSLAFENGTVLADYLYRNDIGVPEANRMRTNIDMDSNNVNNLKEIKGVAGQNPGMSGDTVRVAGNMRATIDIWANNDILADRDIVATRDITAGRTVSAEADVHAHQNVIADNNLIATRNLDVGGSATIDGNTIIGGAANIVGNATIDGATNMAQVDLTRTVAVIPGRYNAAQGVKLADLLPRMVAQYSYLVTHGKSVAKPDCGGDRTKARIMVYRQVESDRAVPNVPLRVTSQNGYVTAVSQDVNNSYIDVADGIVASSNSLTWTIRWYGAAQATGATRQALAQTFCYYG